jgi:1-acyl-sn-glycerol-3-phosphate acyltransferase
VRGPAIVVANHPSYLDALLLTVILPADVTFVAAEVFGRKHVVG